MSRAIIVNEQLAQDMQMEKHPEGGYYKRTFTHPETIDLERGTRARGTCIQFLLLAGQVSHLHRIKGHETWFWHAGSDIEVIELPAGASADADSVKITRIGPGSGEPGSPPLLQYTVPPNVWFGARPCASLAQESGEQALNAGGVLVSCSVVPGFDFQDFELGDRDSLVQNFPFAKDIIVQMT